MAFKIDLKDASENWKKLLTPQMGTATPQQSVTGSNYTGAQVASPEPVQTKAPSGFDQDLSRRENTSFSQRLTGLLSQDSPYMQQAETQGLQTANRRGLLNTSMGVQAAQAARVQAALPIASQEAQQAQQSNLQRRDIQSQQFMQERGLGSQRELQTADIQSRERAQAQDQAFQERIAAMNLSAAERDRAASLAQAFESGYSQMISTVMQNENIPAAARDQYFQHAAKVRDSNLKLVEQMYGIELNWETPGSTSTTSQPQQTTPPVSDNVPRTPSRIGRPGVTWAEY